MAFAISLIFDAASFHAAIISAASLIAATLAAAKASFDAMPCY
jgi:hypothetical protein